MGKPVAWRRKTRVWIGGDRFEEGWALLREEEPGAEPLYATPPASEAPATAGIPVAEIRNGVLMARVHEGKLLGRDGKPLPDGPLYTHLAAADPEGGASHG